LNDFFFARSQMGMSLAFHIVFAVIGMAMPLLMAVSEGCYLWTKKPIFLELSKRWAAGTAILFAVGAVSGTVLSFELGLLWPKFMQYAGGIIRTDRPDPHSVGGEGEAALRLYKPFLRGRRQTRSTTSRASLGFPYGENQYD